MAFDTERTLQKVDVRFEYEVAFTEDVFNASNPLLGDVLTNRPAPDVPLRVMFAVEKNVAETHLGLPKAISDYLVSLDGNLELSSDPAVLAGGECWKSFERIKKLCAVFAENGLCRHSFLGIVGGGAFLDTVGFAASLVHRGLRQIRFPTTTLSQCDSGVGVKTGVNMFGKKNYLGTFAPPYAVINDSLFLESLEYRDWISGVPEAFKVAMIADADFFEWLLNASARLADRDEPTMRKLIKRSAALHLNHIAISGDPFETGSARPLDFGHWVAHKLESMTGGALRHGEAVGIGVLVDTAYAAGLGLVDVAVRDKVGKAFERMRLPVFHEALLERKSDGALAVLDGVEDFREHLGGELHVTLPDGVGRKLEVASLDLDAMSEIIHSIAVRS